MSADDFEDDGGTPAWRSRQQFEAQRVSSTRRKKERPPLTWAYRDLTYLQMFGWFILFPTLGLFFFYVFGLLLCYWGVAFGWSVFWAATPLFLVAFGRIITPNEKPAGRINHYRRN